MPIVEVSAYYAQCDGPAAVPWEDHCAAKFPLSYDKAALEEEAIGAGWSADGRRRYCPQHAPAATTVEKPARKGRAVVPEEIGNQ